METIKSTTGQVFFYRLLYGTNSYIFKYAPIDVP